MAKRAAEIERFGELVSAIYRSVQEDSAWRESFDLLRRYMDANVGCLRIATKGPAPKQYLFAEGPLVTPEALDEWASFHACELAPSGLKSGDTTITDWLDDAKSPLVLQMLERFDVGSTITMCLLDDQGSQITLNCSRGTDERRFDADDRRRFADIGGHFQRAIDLRRDLMSAHLTNLFQTQALDSLGIAAIMVGQSNVISPLNATARFALERGIGLKQTQHGIVTATGEEDVQLRKLLKAALSDDRSGQSHAMSIYRDDSFSRIHLVVRSQTCPSLVSAEVERCALIFMRINEVVDEVDIKLLQEQFSFTMTEANVAIGLAQGLRLKDVEEQLNIRHNTARAHLRSMFSKADVERQSQLVSLLTSSLVPLGRDPNRLLQ